MKTPILRVARPSDDLDALLKFYCTGLGLKLRYRFQDHAGFDGIILGREGEPYHLEFTKKRGHVVGRAPTSDHLLVYYFSSSAVWELTIQRMQEAGFSPARSFNPYWDANGITFEDPDGYRVVLQNSASEF